VERIERPWNETTSYTRGSDGRFRPYLWLTLQSRRGESDVPIVGLVDSGADKSVLPLDYAELLGYETEDLSPVEVGQVDGSADAWDTQEPCEAFVRGIPSVKFEIRPLFVATLDALWGRADLMSTYVVSIDEKEEELTLHLP